MTRSRCTQRADERRQIVRAARWPLLLIGIVERTARLSADLLWAWSVWLSLLFPVWPRRRSGSTRSSSFFRRSGSRTTVCTRSSACVRKSTARSAVGRFISTNREASMGFGVIIIGDEILSGDAPTSICQKSSNCWRRAGCRSTGRNTSATIRRASPRRCARTFASGDIVFSTGGIGATPDDHTRQCAAAALGVPLELHPEAAELIRARIVEMAERRRPLDLDSRRKTVHRLNMGTFPKGAVDHSEQLQPDSGVFNRQSPFRAGLSGDGVADDRMGARHAVCASASRAAFMRSARCWCSACRSRALRR